MEMNGREVQREPEPRSSILGLTEGMRMIGSGLWAGQNDSDQPGPHCDH